MPAKLPHPPFEQLSAWIERGELRPEVVLYAAVRATTAHCPECRKNWRALASIVRLREREGGERPTAHQAAQHGVLDLATALPFDRRRAHRVLSKLALLPREQRLRKVERARTALRNPALVEAAIEKSKAALGESVECAFHWLEVAEALRTRLHARDYPASLLAALSLRLLARRANVYRVAEDYPAAEALWLRIRSDPRLLEILDPCCLGELASLEASFLQDLRCRVAAMDRLRMAYALFALGGSKQGLVDASIQLGNVAFYGGDFHRAKASAEQALRLIGNEKNRQWLLASHSLALYSCSLGEFETARRLHQEIEPHYLTVGDSGLELARQWLAARIAVGHEEFEPAQVGFNTVRATYLQGGLAYDAALVTLDLAELHLSQGHLPAVQTLAQETLSVFEKQGVPTEAARAIGLLAQAAVTERLTVALLARLRRGLGGRA